MSQEIDPIDLQIEQLKLAKETTRLLLRGCPSYIIDPSLKLFQDHIAHLQLAYLHIQSCKFDEESRTCACGFLTAKGLIARKFGL